jgi:hypothetical protein
MRSVLSTLGLVFVAACSGSGAEGAPAPAAAAPTLEPSPPPPAPPTADAGSSDAARGDAAPQGPFDYCTAQAARYNACFPSRPFDLAACKKEEACFAVLYHPDVALLAYQKCITASCSGGGTSCLKHIGNHVDDPAFKDYLAACKTRLDECGDLGPLQFEDDCSAFATMGLKDEVLADRAACLTSACGEIRACMRGKMTALCSD